MLHKTFMKNSPYNLLQEIYRDDPWKMLICCIFLNQTSRKQVDQVREDFFNMYPDPKTAIEADHEQMAEVIKVLGFKNMRTRRIKKFSQQFMDLRWVEPIELHGIGQYAQDSWDIFQKYNFTVVPTDSVLKRYLSWVHEIYNERKEINASSEFKSVLSE